jgi:hypothetical protein
VDCEDLDYLLPSPFTQSGFCFVLSCFFFFFLIQLPSLVSLAFNLGVCLNSFVFQQLPAGAALIFGLSRSLM